MACAAKAKQIAESAIAARNIVAFMESDPRSAILGVEITGRV
jgi:hypothetical protein